MKKIIFAASAILLFFGACSNLTGNTQLTVLEKKIAALEKTVDKLNKRAVLRPAPPEPQKTAYNLPIGKSYIYGEKTAAVTITVFTDAAFIVHFQIDETC